MSYFRKHIDALDGYVPGEQPTDPVGVIKLNTNENPYPPSPKVLEAIRAVTPDRLRRYPDPLGNQFRDAAAAVFDVRREMVICGNGMDDILNLAVRAFSGPEAKLVYPTPTYTLYAVLARIEASVVHEVPFGPNYELPVNGLLEAAGSVTFLANPNSPSGTFVPKARIRELARGLRGVLVIDEAYVDFADETCLSLAREHENVLVFRTLSKGYSLAGVRFGFGIGHPALIEGLMKVKDSYNVDVVALAAATAAIQDQAYARGNWQKVRRERVRMTAELRAMGFSVYDSQSNFLLAGTTGRAARDLYESLKVGKILIRYFDYPGLSDKLRITIGRPDENDALLAALRQLMP